MHVGGWDIGNTGDTDFRPSIEHSMFLGQPVIVVASNYRLNEIFALEWVQKHISAFGGDPKRVVLGGVSAGAWSWSTALLVDNKRKSSDLFRGAFMACSFLKYLHPFSPTNSPTVIRFTNPRPHPSGWAEIVRPARGRDELHRGTGHARLPPWRPVRSPTRERESNTDLFSYLGMSLI
ncbi:Alpha/Beta hydrolase protein [Mycena rebaudengoi]|nr:Alpha/Beta hydrolase protein [Mycena rebaudengoi]